MTLVAFRMRVFGEEQSPVYPQQFRVERGLRIAHRALACGAFGGGEGRPLLELAQHERVRLDADGPLSAHDAAAPVGKYHRVERDCRRESGSSGVRERRGAGAMARAKRRCGGLATTAVKAALEAYASPGIEVSIVRSAKLPLTWPSAKRRKRPTPAISTSTVTSAPPETPAASDDVRKDCDTAHREALDAKEYFTPGSRAHFAWSRARMSSSCCQMPSPCFAKSASETSSCMRSLRAAASTSDAAPSPSSTPCTRTLGGTPPTAYTTCASLAGDA
eukprot:6185861-Pleurochrysis_carterae.AAC.4